MLHPAPAQTQICKPCQGAGTDRCAHCNACSSKWPSCVEQGGTAAADTSNTRAKAVASILAHACTTSQGSRGRTCNGACREATGAAPVLLLRSACQLAGLDERVGRWVQVATLSVYQWTGAGGVAAFEHAISHALEAAPTNGAHNHRLTLGQSIAAGDEALQERARRRRSTGSEVLQLPRVLQGRATTPSCLLCQSLPCRPDPCGKPGEGQPGGGGSAATLTSRGSSRMHSQGFGDPVHGMS